MTPADLDIIYLRLAQAIKRFEVRRAAQHTEPLTLTQPAPATPPSGHRGPYRPRRRAGVTALGHA
jgi:hypothetical protein